MTLGLMGVNSQEVSAAVINDSIIADDSIITEEPIGFSNQSDDVFDGYDSMETTMTGRVGYNYAITLPNGEDLKFGFDPRDTVGNTIDFSGIGSGWKIKLPFLDGEDMRIHRANGYAFPYVIEESTSSTSPSPAGVYTLIVDSNKMLRVNGPYGKYEIYDISGRITNITDSLDNTITYEYIDGFISEINYSDGATVVFERTENQVDIVYNDAELTRLMASFKLSELGNRLVLSEIVFNNSGLNELLTEHPVLFEYVVNLSGGLLLKKYDNGRYVRTIEYLNNSDKISGYSQIFASGEVDSAIYKYGQYDYISEFCKSDYTETYLYEKLSNNCLKKSITKIYDGIISFSTRTEDVFGRVVEYTCPGTNLVLAYENDCIILQKENDNIYTYMYNDDGTLKQTCLPSGEILTYPANNEVEVMNVSSTNNETSINGTRSISQNLYIVSDVNEEVGVTNFFLDNTDISPSQFNCYGYALGWYNWYRDPGYYSGGTVIQDDTITLGLLKTLTETDMEAMGKTITTCLVGTTVNSGSRKVALRVGTHKGYHFMRITNGAAGWTFKSGSAGVMMLKDGKNPSEVSWDTYDYNHTGGSYGQPIANVIQTSYYTSGIVYYMIGD